MAHTNTITNRLGEVGTYQIEYILLSTILVPKNLSSAIIYDKKKTSKITF